MSEIVYEEHLLASDRLVLRNLAEDLAQTTGANSNAAGSTGAENGKAHASSGTGKNANGRAKSSAAASSPGSAERDNGTRQRLNGHTKSAPQQPSTPRTTAQTLSDLDALNNPSHPDFLPTVIASYDVSSLRLRLPKSVDRYLLTPYVNLSRRMVRHPTDGMMLTYLLLYTFTTIPSAIFLFYRFTYIHAILHFALGTQYMGTYNCMRHQHIHQNGVLSKSSLALRLVDYVFPYITDPLMGHTWNSYFYHHVKHHHVEGNGPGDLSSTVYFQRDSFIDFLQYWGRFFFFIWFDLPRYFLSRGRTVAAFKCAAWEVADYVMIATVWKYGGGKPTFWVLVLPFLVLRFGLMAGNWGQHAFVDWEEPDSDFRSSITLIDVMSNRYCFNDGYHTSHHLNPLRHWREHPAAFLRAKETYAKEGALVFHNIDYIMITVKLMMKDYAHLARCMVPIGDQVNMTLEERAELLRKCTRKFTKEEIETKFKKAVK